MRQEQASILVPFMRAWSNVVAQYGIPHKILSNPADHSVVPALEFSRRIIELSPNSSLSEGTPSVPYVSKGRWKPELNHGQGRVDAVVRLSILVHSNESSLNRRNNSLIPETVGLASLPWLFDLLNRRRLGRSIQHNDRISLTNEIYKLFAIFLQHVKSGLSPHLSPLVQVNRVSSSPARSQYLCPRGRRHSR